MRMKDKDFVLARETYEGRYASGDMSVSVAIPLAQIYLYYGELGPALAILERFVAANPGNAEALALLGKYYKAAHRKGDYQVNLGRLAALAATPEILRELVGILAFRGQDEERERALTLLIDRFTATPAEYGDLARLRAAIGMLEGAAHTIETLAARQPEAVDLDLMALLVSVLIDLDRADDALAWARLYVERNAGGDAALRLALLLDSKDRPGRALDLLEAFAGLAADDPSLLAELVSLESRMGRVERAFDRLLPLYEADLLPAILRDSFIELALRRGEEDLAFAAAERFGPESLADWLLAGLVEAVVNRGRPDIARALLDRLGEGFLAARPILAARLALLRGEEAAARRWAAAAAADPDLRLDQRIGLAGLYQRLGRDGDALALLRALAQSPDAPETVVADLAQLYLDLGRAAEGVAVLDALRAERPSPRINAAWALLTAAAKGDAAVLAWLETAPDAELGDRLLEDLYFIASANDADALALAAAERLYARRPDARRELYLARALIASGRPGEALARLRGLLPGDAEVEGAYLEALTAALKDGQPVREELVAHLDRRLADPNLTEADRDALVSGLVEAGAYTAALPILESLARTRGGPWFWTFTDIAAKAGRADLLAAFLVDELDRPGLSRKQREERLYLLMERGGVAAALPYLEVFADEYGGQWIFAYAEALDRAGRADAATDYFERVALDPGLDAEARRGIAFRLLEAGRKAAAERIFMTLAEAEPPSSPDLQQLLYLWGPRPPADRVDWLVLRGEAVTDGRDRAGWMRALVDVGAAERALALAGPDGGPAEGPVFEAYLEALAVLRLRARLAEGLALLIPIEDAPRKLRWLGQLAADNQLPAQALAAYEKLLIALPRNAEVLREAGLAALAEGALERAREHLTRYFELAAGDAEINFVYGDLLAELGWRDLAAFHYARALDSIDGEARPDYALRVLRASALARLGEVDRAIEAFEDLRAERPGDPNLRADFAALLIESQRYGRAGHVLSTE